jgi:hypothetical protein
MNRDKKIWGESAHEFRLRAIFFTSHRLGVDALFSPDRWLDGTSSDLPGVFAGILTFWGGLRPTNSLVKTLLNADILFAGPRACVRKYSFGLSYGFVQPIL